MESNHIDPLPLKTSDDEIWSTHRAAAHQESNQDDLREALIRCFADAGKLPGFHIENDGRVVAYYYRDCKGAPAPHLPPQKTDTIMVYWTGAQPD